MKFGNYISGEVVRNGNLPNMKNLWKMDNMITGIIFRHGENDLELWEGFSLTEEEENAIWNILMRHDTEGCSVRGTRKEIARELEV